MVYTYNVPWLDEKMLSPVDRSVRLAGDFILGLRVLGDATRCDFDDGVDSLSKMAE